MKKLYDTPIKAMRKKCIDCTAGSHKEIRLCTIVECAIYPYRFGRRPNKAVVDTLKRFHAENVEPSGGF